MTTLDSRLPIEPRARRIRLPDGTVWEIARPPKSVACGVCGAFARVPSGKGRVACASCGALVLTVL